MKKTKTKQQQQQQNITWHFVFQSTEMEEDWSEYHCKTGQTVQFKVTGGHKWSHDLSDVSLIVVGVVIGSVSTGTRNPNGWRLSLGW